MKFSIIGVVIAFVTVAVEFGFLFAGNELGAGLCLAFGLMVCGVFRFLAEIGGE